jgi:hypothetical protein
MHVETLFFLLALLLLIGAALGRFGRWPQFGAGFLYGALRGFLSGR